VLTADHFLRSGKVRDLYHLPDGRLLLVASDRISAFDVVLPTPIPDKGRVLTGLSRFWFAETESIVPNHLLDTDIAVVDDAFRAGLERSDAAASGTPEIEVSGLRGRVMVCQPAEVVPVEAVVRGFLAGSGWKEYRASGSVGGIRLPSGLSESARLPEPIFTPTTKAPDGEHDQNIDFDDMVRHIAAAMEYPVERAGALAEAIRSRALALYRYASAVAARSGVLIADTKFEFGLGFDWDAGPIGPTEERIGSQRRPIGRRPTGRGAARIEEHLLLIDEALTPDSSRFWDARDYEPGRPQASFDKQFVRDWLERQPWDKAHPGPALPDDVVAGTRERYIAAFERITGASFDRYLAEDVIAR
jgi:phosphoribosylaminoimidazole-succinocarboxamide synthase